MTISTRPASTRLFNFHCWSMFLALVLLLQAGISNSYWLMGANNVLTIQRLDPIRMPNSVSTHVHAVLGGSNFGFNTSTALLRSSQCTSIPIREDLSNYWYPVRYTCVSSSVSANPYLRNDEDDVLATPKWFIHQRFWKRCNQNPAHAKIDYLFSDKSNKTTAFPDDFRMISGDPTLRTFTEGDFAQEAISYKCLNFDTESTQTNELPILEECPAGIRAQVNFPSCWDGVNVDSDDHQSHVAFQAKGPDAGGCKDPRYPITLPRIFLEVYWATAEFNKHREDAMTPSQPFVFSNGDPTGYGFHADFANGWQPGVLQRAVEECNCNPYGDPSCCVAQGIFTMQQKEHCYVTDTVLEETTGLLDVLPGANPVQAPCYEEYQATSTPAIVSPTYVYTRLKESPTSPVSVISPAQITESVDNPSGECLHKGSAGHSQVSAGFSIASMALLLLLLR